MQTCNFQVLLHEITILLSDTNVYMYCFTLIDITLSFIVLSLIESYAILLF